MGTAFTTRCRTFLCKCLVTYTCRCAVRWLSGRSAGLLRLAEIPNGPEFMISGRFFMEPWLALAPDDRPWTRWDTGGHTQTTPTCAYRAHIMLR